MRTLYAKLVTAWATLYYGSRVIVAERLGGRHGKGTILDSAPHRWARMIARAAGMRIVTHGREQIDEARPHVYVVNHVSIMDIPAVLHAVPDSGFVAKRELADVPLFGRAARAVGVVFIDRENRKSAFAAYEEAADKVRAGRSVIVFPEGTRGRTYELRPFKKGPFVLAIRAGVPIIPVIIHGTIEVTPNGTLDVTPGVVNVHLLDAVNTAGLSYDDRNALADTVQQRMAEAMSRLYGAALPPTSARTTSEHPAPLESSTRDDASASPILIRP
jgi:1-acyl-sn-glycerol-3-phosphate acyltransferase